MGARFADDLLPMPRVQPYGNLVAHGSGRNEDGGLPAKDLGGFLLQSVDGGVFSVDIVPYLGIGHCGSHGGRGWVTVSLRRSIIGFRWLLIP